MFPDTCSAPGFTIQVLTQDFVEQHPGSRDHIIALVATTFCNHEPLCQFLGLPTKKFSEHFVQHVVAKALEDGLSLVAVDNLTGQVAAISLDDDFYDGVQESEENRAFEEMMKKEFPEMLPILALLEHLDATLVERKNEDFVVPKKIFHVFMVATDSAHMGRGLAKALGSGTLSLAKQLGFTHIAVEPTSPITQHIWAKIGATVEYSLIPSDFQFPDGTTPFKKETGESMDREVQICLLDLVDSP